MLNYSAFTADEGIRVTLPEGSQDLTSWTMVWDIRTEDTGGWHGLLALNTANDDDGEFFIHGNRGLGINGQYEGAVPADQWTRLTLSVEDLGTAPRACRNTSTAIWSECRPCRPPAIP